MKQKNNEISSDEEKTKRSSLGTRLRNYFLTGLVIAAPISITLYLTWSFIEWIDSWVKPFIPKAYNPETYLPYSLPGFGLLVALIGLTLLGFLTANFIGRKIISYGEGLLERMPLVRSLHRGLKQIFQTVVNERGNNFQSAGLIQYPRKGVWAVVFISTKVRGEPAQKLPNGKERISVFLPTTPNPTSGFLLMVEKDEIIPLDMSIEDAAKLVISAGLVTPDGKE